MTLSPAGGEISADLAGGFDGATIEGSDIRGRVPITAFEGIATPAGWTGLLELDVERLRIVHQRPEEATGTLFVRALKAPGARGELIGDFQLVVGEGAVGTDTLTGRLTDLGGPLGVRGAIELKRDGSYLMRGEDAPGPGAGPAVFEPSPSSARPTASAGGPSQSRDRSKEGTHTFPGKRYNFAKFRKKRISYPTSGRKA